MRMRQGFGAAPVLLVATCLALTAQAHGPTRQKISEAIEIDAPADKVWSVVGNFQDASWIHDVEKTEGTGGNDVNAKRTLTLKGGATIQEELARYDAAKKTYFYRIDKVDVKVLPVNNYSATIEVEDAGGGKSRMSWKGAFYRGYMNNDPPPELNDEAAKKAVGDLYKASLQTVKDRAEKNS